MANKLIAEAVVWAADVRGAFKISERTLRNWRLANIIPKPDGNILGRDFWRPETYEKMKADVLSGKHSQVRRLPHLNRNEKSTA
jgi:hypothetical protein